MTPMAAIIRFLTVGSCPLSAASNFKSRTGFESLEETEGTDPGLSVELIEVSVEADDEKEHPLARTISVFGILASVGIFRSVAVLEVFPEIKLDLTEGRIVVVTDIGVVGTLFSHPGIVDTLLIGTSEDDNNDVSRCCSPKSLLKYTSNSYYKLSKMNS